MNWLWISFTFFRGQSINSQWESLVLHTNNKLVYNQQRGIIEKFCMDHKSIMMNDNMVIYDHSNKSLYIDIVHFLNPTNATCSYMQHLSALKWGKQHLHHQGARILFLHQKESKLRISQSIHHSLQFCQWSYWSVPVYCTWNFIFIILPIKDMSGGL